MLRIFYETKVVYLKFKLPCTCEMPSTQEAAAKVCRTW